MAKKKTPKAETPAEETREVPAKPESTAVEERKITNPGSTLN